MEGAMRQWEETETEVLKQDLRQRQARRQTNPSTVKDDDKEAAFTGLENGGLDFSLPEMNSGEEALHAPDENSVTQLSGEISIQQKDTGKNKILPDSNPISEGSNSSNIVISEHRKISLVKEIEQEVRELILERLYQKPEAHAFYCPKCKDRIQTVLIQKQEPESPPVPPQQSQPTAPVKCSSCFSFLIPLGRVLIPGLVPKDGKADPGADSQKDIKVTDSPTHSSGALQDKGGKDASSLPGALPRKTDEDALEGNDSMTDSAAKPGALPRKTDEDTSEGNDSITDLAAKPGALPRKTDEDASGKTDSGTDRAAIPKPPKTKVDPSENVEQPQLQPGSSTILTIPEQEENPEPESIKSWEILKCIVYGGLAESIASLGVVTSAASADATTMNIVALALANLVVGLFILLHNLWELKSEQPRRSNNSETRDRYNSETRDRYYELLGKEEHFFLHATFAVLSFILFGLVPPLVYGFSFSESRDKDLKLAAVAVASLVCITVLAIAKAYVQRQNGYKKYLKTVLLYVTTGALASIVSYLAGDLIKKLIEKLGWFESSSDFALLLPEMNMEKHAWRTY